MALRIRKTVYDQMGRVSEELDGTEAEIEAYEKKQKKKNESVQKKKEILHGKAAKALKQQDVLDELKKFLAAELAKNQAVREIHHWYYHNGWWWAPYYGIGGGLTYYFSQQHPTQIGSTSILTCNSSEALSKATGIDANTLTTALTTTNSSNLVSNTISVAPVSNETAGVYGISVNENNGWSSNFCFNPDPIIKTDGSVN